MAEGGVGNSSELKVVLSEQLARKCGGRLINIFIYLVKPHAVYKPSLPQLHPFFSHFFEVIQNNCIFEMVVLKYGKHLTFSCNKLMATT